MAGKKSGPRKIQPPQSSPMVGILLGGVGVTILAVSAVVFFVTRQRPEELPPIHIDPLPPIVLNPNPNPIPIPPAPIAETWWEPNSTLALTAFQLQNAFSQDKNLFDSLGAKSEILRMDAYRSLTAKLPEFLRNESAKNLLARFLIECYALDPIEPNVAALRNWFVKQIPQENAEYPPGFTSADLERSFWALNVSLEALAHNKPCTLDRVKNLSLDLSKAYGFAIDPTLPQLELKARAEKVVALRCYRNILPTAAKSLDYGLTIRGMVAPRVSAHLSPNSRDKVNIDLAFGGLPNAKTSWTLYSLLLKDCMKSEDAVHDRDVIELYGQADPEVATKMEPVLATKWKVVEDEKLNHVAKVKAILKEMGVPDPTDRQTQLEKLSRETLAAARAPAHESLAILQDTARFSHASTLACALMQKENGLAKFDALIANIPELDLAEAKPEPKDTVGKKAPADPMAKPGDPMPAAKTNAGTKSGSSRIFTGELKPGATAKANLMVLKRGRKYSIDMVSDFDSFLRLQNSKSKLLMQDDNSGEGLNARIIFAPPVDDTYRITATSAGTGEFGDFTVAVTDITGMGNQGGFGNPGFGGPGFGPFGPPLGFGLGLSPFRSPFSPFGFPPPFMPPPQPQLPTIKIIPGKNPGGAAEKAKTPAVVADGAAEAFDDADLKSLSYNVGKIRIAAIQSITTKLKTVPPSSDMTPAQAKIFAKYLVLGVANQAEADEIRPSLPPLAKSRNLMLALSEEVEKNDAVQKKTETVVGGLLEQKLQFGKEDWRLGCRKVLLQQVLDLTGSNRDAAAESADIIRDHYREQGVLLGIPPADLLPMTRPPQAMESVIKHLAAKIGKNEPAKADKEQLDQIPRHLLAAQFVAQNDLEHSAMLQRVWIKVLTIHLAMQNPERANELREVQTKLSDNDPNSVNALEQLRGGEEAIHRLWALALDLK